MNIIQVPRQPRTKSKLVDFRYGTSSHDVFGHAYQPRQCARIIFDPANPQVWWQCGHRSGQGPNGLWCGRHAVDPIVINGGVDKPVAKRPRVKPQEDWKAVAAKHRKEADSLLDEVNRLNSLGIKRRLQLNRAMEIAEQSLFKGKHMFYEFRALKKEIAENPETNNHLS